MPACAPILSNAPAQSNSLLAILRILNADGCRVYLFISLSVAAQDSKASDTLLHTLLLFSLHHLPPDALAFSAGVPSLHSTRHLTVTLL